MGDCAHMTTKRASTFLAFMGSATALDGTIPEWLHLLPKGAIQTHDGKNDFGWDGQTLPKMCSFYGDAEESRIPVDINHANSKLGTQGQDTPAQGWIVELSIKPDGVWGRVEWNDSGKAALTNKSYRGISPELMVDKKTRQVIGIRGASLTNFPNLKGLVPILNSIEEDDFDMDKFLKDLLAALGLDADTTQEVALQSVVKLAKANGDFKAVLQSVSKLSGAAENASHEAILQSVSTALAAKGEDSKVVTALRGELAELTAQMNSVSGSMAKDKAVAFVDAAIKQGRVGVKALRDHYVEQHMVDSARVEKEFANFPILNGVTLAPEPPKDGSVTLDESQKKIAKLLGIDPAAMKKTREAELAGQ